MSLLCVENPAIVSDERQVYQRRMSYHARIKYVAHIIVNYTKMQKGQVYRQPALINRKSIRTQCCHHYGISIGGEPTGALTSYTSNPSSGTVNTPYVCDVSRELLKLYRDPELIRIPCLLLKWSGTWVCPVINTSAPKDFSTIFRYTLDK